MSKSGKIITLIFIIAVLILAGIWIFASKANAPSPSGQLLSNKIETPPSTTLFFAGDIMLARNVAAKIYATDDPTLPFQKIKDVSSAADITFANLESPFNNKGDHSVEGSLIFNADPKFVDGLKFAGFDVLSTATNHSFDQGQKGIDFTIDWLTANNIIYSGTKHSTAQPVEPILKVNGATYGFLAYSYTALNDGGKTTSPYVKDFNNLEQLKLDIAELKEKSDIVVISMHAGVEYTTKPTAAQIEFAHTAIDAGADMVIGHHPHWIQSAENYNGKWIFYSLGNFVFDQMWSQETREGLTVLATVEKNEIKKIELKPVIIDNYCCPRWADEQETKTILDRINLTSPILFQHN